MVSLLSQDEDNTLGISAISRTANVVTITTTKPHLITTGFFVKIEKEIDEEYNTIHLTTGVPTNMKYTFTLAGAALAERSSVGESRIFYNITRINRIITDVGLMLESKLGKTYQTPFEKVDDTTVPSEINPLCSWFSAIDLFESKAFEGDVEDFIKEKKIEMTQRLDDLISLKSVMDAKKKFTSKYKISKVTADEFWKANIRKKIP